MLSLSIAALLLFVVVAPAGATTPPQVAQYAGRASTSVCYQEAGITRGQNIPGAGGCTFHVQAGSARIVIQDWSSASAGFSWSAWDIQGTDCGKGLGTDEATITIPRGCPFLTVTPQQAAVAGQVFVI